MEKFIRELSTRKAKIKYIVIFVTEGFFGEEKSFSAPDVKGPPTTMQEIFARVVINQFIKFIILEGKTSKRGYGLSEEEYKKITEKCIICGFDKIIDLHHLDHNHKNNSKDNLIGLCPNHHKMIHHRDFQQEVYNKLRKLGFNVSPKYKPDEFYKK